MNHFPIGVMLDSFRQPFAEAARAAAAVGADGVQIYAVHGEFTPENLTPEKRREAKRVLSGYGLSVSALCGDFGGHGFTRKEENAEKIEKSKRVADLALDLGTNIVTTHIGVVPRDPSCERYRIMQEACRELAEYACANKAWYAVETGPEPAAVLKGFLDSLQLRGVAVNLDPANLVMVTGDDPVQAVFTLKDYIVHTHAKDGVMLKPCSPQEIYDAFAGIGPEGLEVNDYFREVPLGTGSVDFPAYLDALDSVGYRGYLTVERETGENPERDIRGAVESLKHWCGKHSS